MSTSVSSSWSPSWSRSRTIGVGVTAALLLLWWWRRRQCKKDALVLTGTRASATGKVLITGGYLVLDRAHTGLVLSLSARFHSTVIPITPHVAHRLHTKGIDLPSIQPQHATQPQQHRYTTTFIVYAPQRSTSASIYNLTYTSGGHFQCHLQQGENNPFIEHTLEITLSLIMTLIEEKIVVEMLKNGILLYLKGDAPFYTSEKETYDQSNGIFTSPLPPDSKTGLGSSAALVASLVAALFSHFGLSPTITTSTSTRTFQALTNTTDTHDTQVHLRSSLQLRDQDIIHIAHACAQLCHCIAQGKIGSGFDISTAFYGNQQYRRFTSTHIQPLIDRVESKQYIPAGLLLRYLLPSSTLRDVTTSSPTKQDAVIWDHTVTPLVLPPGLILVLGDVHGGSKTPGMVKQVLSWRDTHPESESIWNALATANQSVEHGLRALYHASTQDRPAYDEGLATCAKLPAKEWSTLSSPIATLLFNVHTSFQQVRSHLVTMGNACGVEIEPTKQTTILNAACDVAGVLFAGVPGAGGSDAIFTIVLSPTVIPQVERVWAKSNDVKIRRLPVEQDTVPGVIVSKPTLEVDRWSLFRV